jgi:hypothetical protein
MSVDEPTKPTVSPTSVADKPHGEPTVVEVPVSTLPAKNPLAKLISTMLPNANAFVPNSNGTNNRPVSPSPMSNMNNDAPPFVPIQHQHGGGQQHLNNTNAGQWGGPGTRGGGGGNRRGQSGVRFLLGKLK